ncbi:hypothetical protein ENSA5_69060 [Enhygromyxa salina]|uniref:Phosphate-specific transport system accessory protein PhoU n=1 Tax=Enhygromyxa salina TaxID=215803 RepID=A0A2S9XAT5_9BACT|nr:phosphate signaling complex protein PhoU [Enhygromyxa salina]PRP89965.1 hypothetical protein ENSA5_69060 [Enhygromyxa salina]
MKAAISRRHTHRDFESELRALNEALLSMAGRVEQMIGQSVRALFARDVAMAHEVRETDRLVNHAEKEIDRMCLRILARRQPMGSDLRFLTRALKMVTDIERVGDLAGSLARQAIGLAKLDRPDLGVHPAIERMAELVRSMLADALDAFVERDTALAHQVIERDKEVNALHDQVCRDVFAHMQARPEVLPVGLHVQEAAKFLERMGDHATNLAEQVVFLVHAEDIRHPGSGAS